MKRLALLSVSAILMVGCATAPDPAKVCTSEWIAPRANKAVTRVVKKTRPAINALKKVGESYVSGKTPNIFAMMKLSSSFESLEKELTNGRGIQDIRVLAKTCDNPEILTKAVRDVFERQGVSDKLLGFIENLDVYKRILEENFAALKDIELPTVE